MTGRGAAIAAAALAASHALDATHFLRIALQDLIWTTLGKRVSITHEDQVVYRCWPVDVDRNGHMNNAKYLRVLNYARRNFWMCNGMWDFVRSRSPKANMVVTASTIRYRKEIRCYDQYAVVTRLLHWSKVNMYLEHRFESLTDRFVYAVCFVKYRVIASDKPEAGQLLAELEGHQKLDSPLPSPELNAWMKYDELSSAALRPTGGDGKSNI